MLCLVLRLGVSVLSSVAGVRLKAKLPLSAVVSPAEPDVRVAPPAPPLDPCQPSPCGINADCTVRGDRPVCTCPIGYEGDPLSNCRRGECIGKCSRANSLIILQFLLMLPLLELRSQYA